MNAQPGEPQWFDELTQVQLSPEVPPNPIAEIKRHKHKD
jgi:hypothetical protein